MHGQAVAGESVKRMDESEETLFSDTEMLSTPQPIMAPPMTVRSAFRAFCVG